VILKIGRNIAFYPKNAWRLIFGYHPYLRSNFRITRRDLRPPAVLPPERSSRRLPAWRSSDRSWLAD